MVFHGNVTFLDPPRADNQDVFTRAGPFGIQVKMMIMDHVESRDLCGDAKSNLVCAALASSRALLVSSPDTEEV